MSTPFALRQALSEYPLFFKVKIYSGTDNFQTTKRQFRRHMFLSSIDFSMIMVWWFESGMIEWLWCDGLQVVYAKENNWRKCKQLWTKYTHFFLVFFKLQNTTQSTPYFSGFCNFFISGNDSRISWRPLKTRSLNLQSWLGLMLCTLVYPLKTLKTKSVLFYSFFYQ